jgi:hypothetical protein
VKLAVIDFDHTLFMTEEFWTAAIEATVRLFGTEYGVTVDRLEAERGDRRPGSLGRVAGGEGYDFFTHLSDGYGIDPAVARAKLTEALCGGSWLYPYARELIQHLQSRGYAVVITTVGVTDFQYFKLDCVPGLYELADDFLVLSFNKGDMTRYSLDGFMDMPGDLVSRIVLICDSPATFEAVGNHANLLAIQVVGRPKNPRAIPAEGVHGITGLEQAPALIHAFEAEC